MFLQNLLSTAQSVGVLYIMVAVGFVCDKIGLFTEQTARKLIDLLVYIIGSCLMISTFITMEYDKSMLSKFLISLGLAFLTHIIGIVLNIPFFRKKDNKSPVLKYASIYGNTGFMALPLAQAVLGAEGVFYCTNGVIAYNIFSFTHGFKAMAGDDFKLNIKKLILNPGVVSAIIGMPIFLLQIKLPYVITQPISLIGSLNTPVAMLIFGTYLSKTNLKQMLFKKEIYLVALCKLIIMPLACLGVYKLIGISGAMLTATIITAAVPSGNNTFMFASKFNKDYETASQTVALVSFISILTLPTIVALAQL